jgi:predicted  nucleic acid-binding Zn-ribbon protein
MNDAEDQHVASSYTTISTNRTTDETIDNNLQDSYEIMEHLLGGIQALSDDTQRLNSESHSYQNTLQVFSEDLSKVKVAIQETNSLLDAHKSNQQVLEQNLASLQQQIDDLKNTTYDGTLTWKITNIQQKIGRLNRDFSDEFSFVFLTFS